MLNSKGFTEKEVKRIREKYPLFVGILASEVTAWLPDNAPDAIKEKVISISDLMINNMFMNEHRNLYDFLDKMSVNCSVYYREDGAVSGQIKAFGHFKILHPASQLVDSGEIENSEDISIRTLVEKSVLVQAFEIVEDSLRGKV